MRGAAGVGIEMAVAVVGGMLAGHWADGKLATSPWLALAGVVIGSAVGLKALLRAAKTRE